MIWISHSETYAHPLIRARRDIVASRILFGNSARPRSSGFESESDARNKRRAIPDRIPLHSFSIASHQKSANASSTPFPLSSLLSLRTFFHTENNLAKKNKTPSRETREEVFYWRIGFRPQPHTRLSTDRRNLRGLKEG